jgi:hypothetical protein
MAAMHFAALHNPIESPSFIAGGATRRPDHGLLYGILRSAPPEHERNYRAALAMLDAMTATDRADIGIKPADFPRIAREMALH